MRNIALLVSLFFLISCSPKPDYTSVEANGDEIAVDIAKLNGPVPVFFSYTEKGKRYDFFVHIIDGEVRSYVDACFKCGPEKKGFETDGRRLRCRACGESFLLGNLSGVGSCYPIPLQGEIKAGKYIISIRNLVSKSKYPI